LRIWVDADACPRAIKDILYRAAERASVRVTLVANQPLHIPRSMYIDTVQVPRGFDEADHRIVQLLEAGDLVITADIPLAADVVKKGGEALGFRGEEFNEETIGARLATRNLMDQLRSEGLDTGGPSGLSKQDRQAFGNGLDRVLARWAREARGGAGV
jgi:uncharacterized protein YaiI (UPF0178 family)